MKTDLAHPPWILAPYDDRHGLSGISLVTTPLTSDAACGRMERSPHTGVAMITMTTQLHPPSSYHARIDTAGRVTIPAELRHRQGFHSGDEVVLVPHDKGVEIKTYEQALSEAQDLFCRAIPRSRVLSKELIAERRHDAALDD